MSPDALAVEIRTRTHWEAIDLGLALVQTYWRNLYAAWFVVVLPVVVLALALDYLLDHDSGDGIQYGILLIWWLKPFYDRALLHVLSRAVFGETVTWRGVLRAIPSLLKHSCLFRALTWRRIMPSRSFELPIWQLEGIADPQVRRRRFHVLKRRGDGAIRLLFVCGIFEMILLFGVLGLLFMMLPPEFVSSRLESFADLLKGYEQVPFWFKAIHILIYLFAISIIEPFYVAAGFSLYLTRRTELEGWDIELGFRTLATRLETRSS
ncbi:MAG: hypothetical protein LBE22_09035 [Azoarcus sp.]|nr:hypothetical protein [Azoarcus sp.]